MSLALSLLSKACFAWVILYVVLSIRSALWIGSRHGGKVFLLEFQSRRARGKRESARARWLKAMGIGAALAMPVGIVAFVASLVGPWGFYPTRSADPCCTAPKVENALR